VPPIKKKTYPGRRKIKFLISYKVMAYSFGKMLLFLPFDSNGVQIYGGGSHDSIASGWMGSLALPFSGHAAGLWCSRQ
jgi:hypothetical protein